MNKEKRAVLAEINDFRGVYVQEMRTALDANLVIDKVGLKMQKGKRGDLVYAVIGGAEASFANEDVELTPSLINIDATKKSDPQLIWARIRLSNRAQALSGYDLYVEGAKELGRSLSQLLNKWLVSPTEVTKGGAVGPFVKDPVIDANQIVKFAGDVPTFEEIVSLETKVVNANIYDPSKGMYLVSPSTAGILKLTPIKDGDRMILENNQINGYPVGITNAVPEGVVEFGIFSYLIINEFDEANVIFDPFLESKANVVNAIQAGEYDIVTLNKEAFTIGLNPTAYTEVYQ